MEGVPVRDECSGRTLFTRQSSGLVREVSVVNALFFNTSAFIGGTLGGAFQIAVLAGVPVVVVGGLTNWSWVAFIVGALCILLALIFASLTSVMPRSGGDYVFSSRIVPKVGPFLGWLESWGLVVRLDRPPPVRDRPDAPKHPGRRAGSSGSAPGIDFFNNSNSWFTDGSTGDVTGAAGPDRRPGRLRRSSAWVVLQPTRRFHKIVTYLTVLGIVGWIADGDLRTALLRPDASSPRTCRSTPTGSRSTSWRRPAATPA